MKKLRPGKDSRLSDVRRAARYLFEKHGYENVNTVMIAKEAGISRALIYRYHGTKTGVLSDLLIEFLDEATAKLGIFIKEKPKSYFEDITKLEFVVECFKVLFQHDTQPSVRKFRQMAAQQSWNWDPETETQIYIKAGELFRPMNEILHQNGSDVLDEPERNVIWALYTETLRQSLVRSQGDEDLTLGWHPMFVQGLSRILT
jgi:AcrR family transcriptional regulator